MRSSYLIIIALFCSLLLLSIDVEKAYAFAFKKYDATGQTSVEGITRAGSYVFTASSASDNIVVRNQASGATVTTITGVTDPTYMGHRSDEKYVFSVRLDGSSMYIIDAQATPVPALISTLTINCDGQAIHFDEIENNMYCSTSTETIREWSLNTFLNTYTSTTVNAGATPCTDIRDMWYDSVLDRMAIICQGTVNKVAMLEDFSASGTPDFIYAYATGTAVAYARITGTDNVMVCSSVTNPQIINYTQAVGFTAWLTVGAYDCGTAGHDLVYHASSARYLNFDTAENIYVFDAGTGDILLQTAMTAQGGTNDQLSVYSNIFSYAVDVRKTAGTSGWTEIDLTGVALGTGGQDEPSGGTNQIGGVCGNTDVNGDGRVNVIDCVGNATAWSGFTSGVPAVQIIGGITDGLGITDCADDGSDQETCGSGLFFFILVLLLVEFLVLAGYLGLTSKLGGTREIVDVLLLMLIAGFAVVALSFYLDWIPDLVFYTIIALIAGFLTFGVISKIRGK